MGDDYTIADVATAGWVRNFVEYYKAGDLVGYGRLKNVQAWLARWLERPAVQRGLHVTEKVPR
jgi:GST-like protein